MKKNVGSTNGSNSSRDANNQYRTVMIGGQTFILKYSSTLTKLSVKEFEELKMDIAQRGVQVPIVIDELGQVIDGENRLLIGSSLKMPNIPTTVKYGLSEDEKWRLARDLNFHRRHLTPAQLKEYREQLPTKAAELREDGKSLRQIGDSLGVSHQCAKSLIQEATVKGITVHPPEYVIGKDGKKHPANVKSKKPTTIYATNSKEVQRAIAACAVAGEVLPQGHISVKRAERLARVKIRHDAMQKEVEDYQQGEVNLMLGDFRERACEIPNESTELIFTDPQYDKAWLSHWEELSRFAFEKLKPGGLLITYSGSLYLLEVMNQLATHLSYLWMGAIIHNGDTKLMPQVRMFQNWKPLLIFYKPPLDKHWSPFADIIGGSKSKEFHPWEQSVIEAAHFIKGFGKRGGTLLDPCMGSGTNLVAGLQSGLGLRLTGIEIDKATFVTAQKRIQDVQDEIAGRKEPA